MSENRRGKPKRSSSGFAVRSAFRSRPTTSGSRPCSRTATMRGLRPISSRAIWNGRAPAAEDRPAPRGPSPDAGAPRRLMALAAVVAVVVAAIVAVIVALPHVHRTHALPPPPPPPKPFRIVFPEGFTRAQMAVRVRDVAQIAKRKSHKPVKLTLASYNASSRSARIPVFPAEGPEEPRGLPLSRDVRLPPVDHVAAARP